MTEQNQESPGLTLMDLALEIEMMVDSGQVDVDLLRDINLGEIQTVVSAIVSKQLSSLSDLGEDAESNEQALRASIEEAALKSFLTGLAISPASQGDSKGVTVPVSAETMTALVTHIIGRGELSITLAVE